MSRKTLQRDAILAAVADADGPLSPMEILDAAAERVPGVGLATVYRTVKLGVETGELQAVELPTGPTRYEPADRGHHHHFECRQCQHVYDIEGCPGRFDRLLPDGFTLESHDLVLHGLCESCKDTAAA